MDRWTDKVALVTGASDGIGAVIAKVLVEHGMKVIGCARNLTKLNDVATEANQCEKGEMFSYQCDLMEENQILKMFSFIKEKFGTIHVCINNAAIIHNTSILEGKTSVSSLEVSLNTFLKFCFDWRKLYFGSWSSACVRAY